MMEAILFKEIVSDNKIVRSKTAFIFENMVFIMQMQPNSHAFNLCTYCGCVQKHTAVSCFIEVMCLSKCCSSIQFAFDG